MPIERSLNVIQAALRDPRLEAAADLAVKAAAVLAFLFALSAYLALPTLPIQGHDEVHYYVDFTFKLVEDGRWLNHLLHDFLRSMPLPVWSVLYLVLWWGFIYRLGRIACAFDAPMAALVASTALVTTPFLEISLWPASFAPALLVTWLALLLHQRGVAYQVIYLVTGMLMFGTLQTPYFLLPLLFLQPFLDTSTPLRARLWLLFRHMLWWVAGAVAGVLVMCVMLRLLVDIWFLQPAEWRATQPVESLASLVANISYVTRNFFNHLKPLLVLGGVTWVYVAVCAAVALLRARVLLAQTPAWLLIAAVLISFHVFSIPMAPIIHHRSLLALATGVVLVLALLPGRTAAGRVLAALLLLKLVQNFSEFCQDYIETQRAETAVFLSELSALFPGYPMAYATLALEGTMDPAKPEARRFNDGGLMHPIMVTLGVPDFLDCRIPDRCNRVGPTGAPIAVHPFAGGQLELAVDSANNIGVVRYRE